MDEASEPLEDAIAMIDRVNMYVLALEGSSQPVTEGGGEINAAQDGTVDTWRHGSVTRHASKIT